MRRARPAFYAALWAQLIGVARDDGYALAIHGSLTKDLDLIAVPWTEDAVPAERLIRDFANMLGGYITTKSPENKPHGRLSWSIVVESPSPPVYVDVSVMPRGGA